MHTPTRSTILRHSARGWLQGLIATLALAGAVAARPSDASAELAAARAALGWDALAAGQGCLRIVGDAHYLGTQARQTLLFDGRGRFEQSFDGPLAQRSGCDGELCWNVDWNGTAGVLELGDRSQAELGALFLTGAWTLPGGVLDFTLATSDAGSRLHFAHADGVLAGWLQLDAQTRRPAQLEFGSGDDLSHWEFADYREHAGFWFPERITLVQSGLHQDFNTRSVEHLAEVPSEAFRARAGLSGDTRFDAELPPGIEVKRVPTGHVLVHPLIDGLDLGWFIFDSGAGTNCISTHVAKDRLDGPFGEIAARGVGGTVPAGFWRAESLQLGPVTIAGPIFMGLDLAFLAGPFGVEVAGILGYEFLARCTVEFDPSAPSIALYDPARFALPGGGHWRAALLYNRHPCVQASFEGREGLFKIDTGAAGDTVTFHFQAVRDLNLLEGRDTTAGMAGGVGGQVATREGVLARFELGGHAFRNLPAAFAAEERGAFDDDYVLGNIGGKLLEPFVLVFDYPARRLGFVPK